MQTIAAYSTPGEAHVALSRLHSAGIAAVTRDELTVCFNWLWSDAIGGVKIDVPDDQYADAVQVLNADIPGQSVIRCAHCASSEIMVRPLSPFGAVCLMLKLPIPMTVLVADCRTCKKAFTLRADGKSA
jgi:hypothetical protein